MVIFSMSASVDGFINDREGAFNWTAPDDELFRFHTEQVGGLGAYFLGRKLYEAMLVWETDPSMRADEDKNTFADIWCALPKVVFSHTLNRVEGSNTRLAEGSVAEEIAAGVKVTDKPISIGGATLAAVAFAAGLVDELRIFRHPVVVGGGTPYLPSVAADVPLKLIESATFPRPGVIFERYERR